MIWRWSSGGRVVRWDFWSWRDIFGDVVVRVDGWLVGLSRIGLRSRLVWFGLGLIRYSLKNGGSDAWVSLLDRINWFGLLYVFQLSDIVEGCCTLMVHFSRRGRI